MQIEAAAPIGESESDIVRKYDGRIRHMASRFQVEQDDLIQIGRMELLSAARVWNKRVGNTAQLWTYAYKSVLGAMIDEATKRISRVAIEAEFEDEPRSDAGPDAALQARELIALLSVEERKILALHLEGDDVRTIAESVGLSKSQVHRVLSRSLEKLRDRA